MREAWRLLQELWAERARVGLVALGVLWGTLSMGVLLAFGGAMSAATSATADNFGIDLLRVRGNATTQSFAGLPPSRLILDWVDWYIHTPMQAAVAADTAPTPSIALSLIGV